MPGDYLPFGHLDAASGRWQGLDVDVTSAMAKALGVKLELVKTSWSGLIRICSKIVSISPPGGLHPTAKRQDPHHSLRECCEIHHPHRNRQAGGARHYSSRG